MSVRTQPTRQRMYNAIQERPDGTLSITINASLRDQFENIPAPVFAAAVPNLRVDLSKLQSTGLDNPNMVKTIEEYHAGKGTPTTSITPISQEFIAAQVAAKNSNGIAS